MGTPGPTYADQRYADASPVQTLDLYLPQDRDDARRPLVVIIHGGGFMIGDKREDITAIPALLDRGYAIASIGYRLSGEAVFPAAVQDCKAALRWLTVHAEEHGLDRERFALWGASAGGHLAALLGVTGDQSTVFDATSDPAVDASVAAVIDWFGSSRFSAMDAHDRERPPTGEALWDPPWDTPHNHPGSPASRFLGAPVQSVPELSEASDPATYAPTAIVLPPFLIVHGDGDHLVPHLQSVVLAEALAAGGWRGRPADPAGLRPWRPGLGRGDDPGVDRLARRGSRALRGCLSCAVGSRQERGAKCVTPIPATYGVSALGPSAWRQAR